MSQFLDLKSFEISVKAQSLIISKVDFHFFFCHIDWSPLLRNLNLTIIKVFVQVILVYLLKRN